MPEDRPCLELAGTGVAREIIERTAERSAAYAARTGARPCFAAVLVGDDPASLTYIRMKRNRCRDAGMDSRPVQLPASARTAELVATVGKLSDDPTVHGILLQHPVPPHIDERAGFEAIAPEKDVDGVTARSFGAMALGLDGFKPATPAGIMRLLAAYDIDVAGQCAVVVGRSPILGRPMGMLLLAADATVTYCHSRTEDLPAVVATGDIVVAAVGRPEFVRAEWLKPGAVVVDAGYHPNLVGDVELDGARKVASAVTPVPGGVGPMTIALLLEQTVDAAERQARTVAT
jgi:methylenetetrahydrofolate dehydrogenase (NADP+) / methenyltetrahydrofolate cyclohydrolase